MSGIVGKSPYETRADPSGTLRAHASGMTQPIPVSHHAELAATATTNTLWDDMTSGRFRIMSWYDREDRRYVVIRRLAPGQRSCLSARQRRALALRSAGCALKVIALELGISVTTASRELECAMQALGLESTAALAAVLGHVAA